MGWGAVCRGKRAVSCRGQARSAYGTPCFLCLCAFHISPEDQLDRSFYHGDSMKCSVVYFDFVRIWFYTETKSLSAADFSNDHVLDAVIRYLR